MLPSRSLLDGRVGVVSLSRSRLDRTGPTTTLCVAKRVHRQYPLTGEVSTDMGYHRRLLLRHPTPGPDGGVPRHTLVRNLPKLGDQDIEVGRLLWYSVWSRRPLVVCVFYCGSCRRPVWYTVLYWSRSLESGTLLVVSKGLPYFPLNLFPSIQGVRTYLLMCVIPFWSKKGFLKYPHRTKVKFRGDPNKTTPSVPPYYNHGCLRVLTRVTRRVVSGRSPSE